MSIPSGGPSDLRDAATARESVAEINGARLRYAVEGRGPAVVLLHAGIADMRMWDALALVLSSRYHVVRFDLRGFGASSMPEGFFSHAEDLRGLLDLLGIGRAHLVGLSMGGKVAIEFAVRYPLRCVSLTVIAPGLGGFLWSKEMEAYGAKGDAAAERGDLEALVELDLAMWVVGPHRAPSEVDPQLISAMRPLIRAANSRYAEQARGTPQWLDPPALERLHEIRAPVLVVVGDQDADDMLRIAELVEHRVAGARKAVLSHTAHMVPLERPKEFEALLEPFLASASRLPVARR